MGPVLPRVRKTCLIHFCYLPDHGRASGLRCTEMRLRPGAGLKRALMETTRRCSVGAVRLGDGWGTDVKARQRASHRQQARPAALRMGASLDHGEEREKGSGGERRWSPLGLASISLRPGAHRARPGLEKVLSSVLTLDQQTILLRRTTTQPRTQASVEP